MTKTKLLNLTIPITAGQNRAFKNKAKKEGLPKISWARSVLIKEAGIVI
jgi:hypothetical protein